MAIASETSFGDGGFVYTAYNGVAIQPDGKIDVANSSVLARYLSSDDPPPPPTNTPGGPKGILDSKPRSNQSAANAVACCALETDDSTPGIKQHQLKKHIDYTK